MPELPEVETAARSLRPGLLGKRVVAFEVLDTARLAVERPERMLGRVVHAVRRLGKQVVLDLDPARPAASRAQRLRARLWLAVHLRMTGRLLVVDQATAAATAGTPPHLRARWRFDDGSELQFVDPRRFGTVRLHTQRRELTPVGVEPLGPRFTVERLAAMLATAGATPLKVWLMRQDCLVGLGNIYASEILFEARLHPERPASSLTPADVERLHAVTRRVLRRAIRNCGTTFADFQDANGVTGRYQQYLYVYGREGEPCRICGTPIRRSVHAQRSTFWCPTCQPLL